MREVGNVNKGGISMCLSALNTQPVHNRAMFRFSLQGKKFNERGTEEVVLTMDEKL